MTTVADLPEDRLTARLAALLPQGLATVPTGDDAAILPLRDPRAVLATDVLVEGVHFRRDWSTASDIGWRATMQNAADAAAMGGFPTAFLASLVMPGSLPVAWVEDLAHGMSDACDGVARLTGVSCGVVGGDLARGDQIVLAVTVVGEMAVPEPIVRSGARVGDVIAHAGTLGHAAAGLALLQAGELSAGIDRSSGLEATKTDPAQMGGGIGLALERAIAAFRRPKPPLDLAIAAARGGASAMMDVSDGLVRDAGRMARASNVTIELEPAASLMDDVVTSVGKHLGVDPERWVLGGGEDHGFLAAFPSGTPLPNGFTKVGRATRASDAVMIIDGKAPTVHGWDHFGGAED